MHPTTTERIELTLPTGNQSLDWQSAHGWNPPRHIQPVNAEVNADTAYQAISQGKALLWQGDYHQGRQMLAALKRRLNKKLRSFDALELPERFHRIRLQRSQAARQLGLLLIEVRPGYVIDLARAPDAKDALRMAYGDRLQNTHFLVPLSELIGIFSAFEWSRKGLPVTSLDHNIYPKWGVFAPTRHEYLDLVMQAELPNPCATALDVGTGTGVLAMILAKRGINQITATDTSASACACAEDNVRRAGLGSTIKVLNADLIPEGKFDLVVCNPPWLPGAASSPLEGAVYDPEHQMLKGFLQKVGAHLNPNGQAWLILSDLAEHLQLRKREVLLDWINRAGLQCHKKLDARPTHRKVSDTTDPLAEFRRLEVTSLWQLRLSSSVEMP